MLKWIGRFLKWNEARRSLGTLHTSMEFTDSLSADDVLYSQALFPHCDSEVLHAPGECVHCDHYPAAQRDRFASGINFTGHYDAEKIPCPSTTRRSLDTIEKWPGNRPCQPREEDGITLAFHDPVNNFERRNFRITD